MPTLRLLALERRCVPATIPVTSLADSGTGSLRAALAQADSLPGQDTIVFKLPAPPVNSDNIITLTSGELTNKGDVTIVEPFDEQQVGDLLDDLKRIGNPAGPEGIPNAVNLTTDFAGEHGLQILKVADVRSMSWSFPVSSGGLNCRVFSAVRSPVSVSDDRCRLLAAGW
jgi:hypothetical protein